MKTWTIAIAGLGAATRLIHIPAYRKVQNLKIVGGADPNSSATNMGFPIFSRVEDMLVDVKPDILAVVTPTPLHFPLTRMGLEAGCHVFCEKPFTETLDEASILVETSNRVGRWVVVNNQYRFMNIHKAAKEAINTPAFGKLIFLDAHQTFQTNSTTEAGWRGIDPRRTCKEFGIHALDLCRFFFGEDPLAISARMPRGDVSQKPDYLNLICVEFSGDRVAHILLNRITKGPVDYLTIRLDGSAGVLETHIGGGIEFRTGIRGGTRRPFVQFDWSMGGRARLLHGEKYRTIATDPLDVFANATKQLMVAFLAALDQESVPPCHAADNWKSLALMLAAYESSESGRQVSLHYPKFPTSERLSR